MKVHFHWTNQQSQVLTQIAPPFDYVNVDDERLVDMVELVGEHLQLHGLADHDELNEIGLTCETILDEIAKY